MYVIDDEFKVRNHSVNGFYLFKGPDFEKCTPELCSPSSVVGDYMDALMRECTQEVRSWLLCDTNSVTDSDTIYGIVVEGTSVTVTDVQKLLERRELESAAEEEARVEFEAIVDDLMYMDL